MWAHPCNGAVAFAAFVTFKIIHDMGTVDEFLQDDLDDEKTIEFIKNYLPQDLKDRFSDDELYYFLDVIDEYYVESGILDAQPDKDGYIDIDLEKIVDYME